MLFSVAGNWIAAMAERNSKWQGAEMNSGSKILEYTIQYVQFAT